MTWLGLTGKGNDLALARRAHRRALEQPRRIDSEFLKFWDAMQAVFEKVLERTERRFTEITDQVLAELRSRDCPTDRDLEILTNNLPNSFVVRRDFFGNLTSGGWLEPLRTHGFFKYPAEPERDLAQGTVRFPPWPLTQYLARMAQSDDEQVRQTVLSIAQEIPDTENVSVHEDLAEIGLQLPLDLAIQLIPRYFSYLDSAYLLRLPTKLGEIAVRFAEGGKNEEALQLLRALMDVTTDKRYGGAEEKPHFPPRVVSRIPDWAYQNFREKELPRIVDACDIGALRILVEVLGRAVDLSLHQDERKERVDFSYIWMSDLTRKDPVHDVRSELVISIRKAVKQILDRDPGRLGEVVKTLELGRWFIFDRLVLNVLANAPQTDNALVTRRLLDEQAVVEYHLRTEYVDLLVNRFQELGDDDRDQILHTLTEKRIGEEIRTTDKAEIEEKRNTVIASRLQSIEEHLSGKWKKLYDTVRSTVPGTMERRRPESSMGTFVGPTSPRTEQELESMTIEQITDFLREWEPEKDHFSPSPEGLARILAEVVKKNPNRFAKEANRFEGLDPTYVNWIFHGLEQALRNGEEFEWKPVIDLCLYVVQQPRDEVKRKHSEHTDLDPGWGWTRKSIASLLREDLKHSDKIPSKLSQDVWSVIEALAWDSDPTPEHEAQYGGSNMDPINLAINSTRSEAIAAAVRFGCWLTQKGENSKLNDEDEKLKRAVIALLEDHLNPDVDPSFAVRSVYGSEFWRLMQFDEHWAKEIALRIFPSEDGERRFWDAAWEGFISHHRPHQQTFSILSDQYGVAVSRVGTIDSHVQHFHDPEKQLGVQLSILYFQGVLEGDQEELLRDYFRRASVETRSAVLGELGRMLRRTEGEVPEETARRLKRLWKERVSLTEITDNADLGSFGEWFASGKLDDEWTYPMLVDSLKKGGKLDFGHEVVKKLAGDARTRTEQTLSCVDLMIEGDESGWHLDFWKDDISTILAAGLEGRVKGQAREIINRLIARGYVDYRRVLEGK
jgi:hypothetical protein